MSTKTRTNRQQSSFATQKESYAAKVETLRRKEARKIKYAGSTKTR